MPRAKSAMPSEYVPDAAQPTLLQIIRVKQSEMVRAELSKHTQADSDRRAKKSFTANRFLCAGWSTWNGRRCELFARDGSAYCRYHEPE